MDQHVVIAPEIRQKIVDLIEFELQGEFGMAGLSWIDKYDLCAFDAYKDQCQGVIMLYQRFKVQLTYGIQLLLRDASGGDRRFSDADVHIFSINPVFIVNEELEDGLARCVENVNISDENQKKIIEIMSQNVLPIYEKCVGPIDIGCLFKCSPHAGLNVIYIYNCCSRKVPQEVLDLMNI